MLSSVLSIPSEVFQDRVLSLLDIMDLVLLDSAMLNHNARTQFLEQLRGAWLMTESLPIDNEVAQWLLNRNIRITSLRVSETATDLSIVKQLAVSADALVLVSLNNCNTVTSEDVMDFIQACNNVNSLFLSNLHSSYRVAETVAQSCTTLQTIDPWNLYPTKSSKGIFGVDQLTILTTRCTKLTEINLTRCFDWIDDIRVTTIAVNCPHLQKLILDHCNMCRDNSLQVLAEHCHDLHYLSLRCLMSLTDVGVRALAAGCTELRTVLLLGNAHITSKAIITLAQAHSKLQEIGIPQCDQQIDQAVAALVQHCPALNTLRCWSPMHFTDTSLMYLQNCPLLHTLQLQCAITFPALMQCLECSADLQYLDLNLEAPIAAVTGGPDFTAVGRPFSKLAKIDFMYSYYLTDAEFILLIAQSPNITELDLSNCTTLTDAAVLAAAAHCEKLRNIDLCYVAVSDAAVCALAQGCPDLRSIQIVFSDHAIDYVQELTDTGVSAIAQHCPYLKQLELLNCLNITDAGIVEILQKCRQLRELNLSECDLITRKVLDAAVQYGARLRKLDLRGCTNIGTDAATAFRSAKPNCVLE